MRGYNERDSSEFSLVSWSRGSAMLMRASKYRACMSELLPPRPLALATIRGRLLFFRARFNCGYYSRAATIRGAATIRVNTVCTSTYTYEMCVCELNDSLHWDTGVCIVCVTE